jgi:predicted dehydrogenase
VAATEPLRALIAGLGVMGSNHLRVLSVMPGVEVVAIVDPDPERRAAAIGVRPGVGAISALGEGISEVQPDFVCAAVPVHSLPEVAGEAIALGLPVLVEKPGAPSSDAIR